MNPTIEKIVNLLFEDLVETEDTNAIRDEILINCQERYQDLVESGMTEDDAIAAVIESLNGMEDMLKDYPRKPHASEPETNQKEENTTAWSCDPFQSPIREIRMERMGNADVTVCASGDDLLHVECLKPELLLMTGLENGVLTIVLKEQHTEKEEINFSLEDGFDLSSIGKLFGKLARRITANFGGAEITLAIPAGLAPALHIGAASGDVHMEPTTLESLRISTASGDLTLNGIAARKLQLSSVSGDIEAAHCTCQESVRLNTTSGDIRWNGLCQMLNATSISGDVTLEGEAESITFRTVSGDAELILAGSAMHAITGSTTSGDANVYLPESISADISCTSVSGDIHNRAGSVPGAPVVVKLSTVSGDIEIE